MHYKRIFSTLVSKLEGNSTRENNAPAIIKSNMNIHTHRQAHTHTHAQHTTNCTVKFNYLKGSEKPVPWLNRSYYCTKSLAID